MLAAQHAAPDAGAPAPAPPRQLVVPARVAPTAAQAAEFYRRTRETARAAGAIWTDAGLLVPDPGSDFVLSLQGRAQQKLLNSFEEKYGVVVSMEAEGPMHSHPQAALERDFAEECVARIVRRTIGERAVVLDVGGNASRHAHYQRDTWHSCQGERAARAGQRRLPYAGGHASCTHDAVHCDCVDFDAVAFIFSHYYNDGGEIADLVLRSRSRVGYLVTHDYPDVAGNLCNKEVQYQYGLDGTITVRVGDERSPYFHAANTWLSRGWMALDIQMTNALYASHLGSVGDTHIYRLSVEGIPASVREAANQPCPRWHPAASTDAVAYSIPTLSGLQENALRIGGMAVPMAYIVYFGPIAFFTGISTFAMPVPAAVPSRLALQVVGRARTPELYQSLLRQSASAIARVTNYPDAYKPEATVLCAYAAFTTTLDLEVAAAASLGGWSWRFAIHQAAHLAWGGGPRGPLRAALFAGGALGIVWGAMVLRDQYLHVAAYARPRGNFAHVRTVEVGHSAYRELWRWPALLAAALAAWTRSWVQSWWLVPETPRLFDEHQFVERAMVDCVVSTPVELGSAWTGRRPVPSTALTDVYQRPLDSYLSRDHAPRMASEGICFRGVVVRYYYTNDLDFESAVSNRLALERLDPVGVAAFWATAGSRKGDAIHREYLRLVALDPVHGSTAKFLQHQRKFRPSVQRLRAAAREEVFRNGGFRPEDFRNQFFVKVEKVPMLAVDFELGEPVKWPAPRPIVVHSPAVHAFKGPIIMQAQERLRSAEARTGAQDDHADTTWAPGPVVFGHHATERLGEWFTTYYDAFTDPGGEGTPWAWGGDGDKYDGRWSEAARDSYRSRWIAPLLLKSYDAASFGDMRVRGRGKTGATVNAGVRQGSGADDTWFANSLANYDMALAALGDPFETGGGPWWAGAFGGDDVLLLLSHRLVARFGGPGEILEHIEKTYYSAGFPFQGPYTQDICGVEFYSKRFYPTSNGWMPGAKLGRCLARAGYALHVADSPSIRATALQQLQDNSHVPFLREYFARVVELSSGTAVYGRDHEWGLHASRAHAADDAEWFATFGEFYGLSQGDLIEFKALLAGITSLPAVVEWRHIERLVKLDA